MKIFPQTPNFMGLNTPLGVEWQAFDIDVEGSIPAEIEGTFYRAVPDPQYPPFHEHDTVLADDGMVHRIHFEGGKVHTQLRYVQTDRYRAERESNRRLFGLYRNPYTDDTAVAGVDRTTANTTPIWHGGRLLMAKEDGRSYQVNPETLETIGSWDYNGKLKSLTTTAHPRIDPETGEMFFFGYEADGFCSKTLSFAIANKAGELVSEQLFEAPYAALMHDFVITENYVVFPLFPTIADEARCKEGGLHFLHEQDRDSWLGIMPRYGDVSDIKWVAGPKGVSGFHHMNAFEDAAGHINIDICLYETVFFDFIRFPSGIDKPMNEITGALTRWTVDPNDTDQGIRERVLGPMGDMPRIADQDQGRPYRHGWYLCYNPAGGPPLFGGPLGVTVNQLMRIDLDSGALDTLLLPPDYAINEPVHIPATDNDHGGWLMAVVDHKVCESPEDYRSEVWILRADDINAEPVAQGEASLSCSSASPWVVGRLRFRPIIVAYSEQEQKNLNLVSAMYEAVLKPLDSRCVDQFIVEDYIQHSPLAESGSLALKQFLDFIKDKNPDAIHDVKRMFADGDYVITHTHVIRFEGDPGLAVMDLFRIENDLLAEHWDVIQEIATDSINPLPVV